MIAQHNPTRQINSDANSAALDLHRLFATVGWVLTSRYNATQLDAATKRGAAGVEIARVNAAMRYMELVRNLRNEVAFQAVVGRLNFSPCGFLGRKDRLISRTVATGSWAGRGFGGVLSFR